MENNFEIKHEPVLKKEVIKALQVKKLARLHRARFIDATVGLGGHSEEIVHLGGEVLGIDADNNALKIAEVKLNSVCTKPDNVSNCFTLVHGNFRDIDKIAEKSGFNEVDGILFDLGVSTPQLTASDRGFSFQNKEALLDMRLDPENQGVTAANLLNALDGGELFKLFNEVLEYKSAKKLSEAVVKARALDPILTVRDFILITERVIKPKTGIHSATLPFMALRMAVNSELPNLRDSLPKAFRLLISGGRLAVISFHSGEDRIVKDFFRLRETKGEGILINKKPIVPEKEELDENPKARSAKLRIIEKT